MNTIQPELIITAVALLVAILATCVSLEARRRVRDVVAVITAHEADLDNLRRQLDAATLRSDELARRVAWLESRVRPSARRTRQEEPAAAFRSEVPASPNDAHTAPDLNAATGLTERRHRVLTLARRGMRGNAIAETLGLPHGEVELIINLGRIG
jgi:DNA-binding NarL/FixJ family response regulator